jgi:hypothetical protein
MHYRQQPFLAIANFVVKSHFRFARNFILAESSRLRSSQPRKAAKRYMPFLKKSAKKDVRIPKVGIFEF